MTSKKQRPGSTNLKGREDHHQSSRRVLGWGMLGSVLLWSAFPPLHISYMAFVALLPWLVLVEDNRSIGRRGYLYLWLAGCVLWLALLQGIRLAYWPLYFGWAALSLYLAIYVPLFIGLSQLALHRWRLPLALIAPVIWMGLECIRGYAFTGFSGCLLGHTQVDQVLVLQIADQLGCYGVGAFVVSGSVLLWRGVTFYRHRSKKDAIESIASLAVCASVVLYGWLVLGNDKSQTESSKPLLRIALIQENAPTQFESNPEKNDAFWNAYLSETRAAARKFGSLDVVAWPESVFSGNVPRFELKSKDGVPPEFQRDVTNRAELEAIAERLNTLWDAKTAKVLAAARADSKADLKQAEEPTRPYLLMGSDTIQIFDDRVDRMNTALWIGPDGSLMDIYAKHHLVMFGEYIPFAGWFPGLLRAIGLAPIRPGTLEVACKVDQVVLAPSICFENMIPTATQQQVRTLIAAGSDPDVLINISNDSWFHGTSILDHHLNCGVLTAVENRRPMLVAANTGLSAWIDAFGRKVKVSERGKPGSILAEPVAARRWGLWQSVGDWPARVCGAFCIGLAWSGLRFRRTRKELGMISEKETKVPSDS